VLQRFAVVALGALVLMALAPSLGYAQSESRPYKAGEYEWRLENRSFVATSITSRSGTTPISKPGDVHVGFGWTATNGGPWLPELFWEANCNEYFYRLRATAHRLKLGRSGSTEVGCFKAVGEEDDWLSRFFRANPHWRLQGRRLTLRAGKRAIELKQPLPH